ncbi:TonB-dependent receptor [Polymorphobacter sp.]|uniref:TonB-dependent receptor n=1 Tax=Polymorphobacter sp. TaxID=1909290 RepID=UPI003F724222
MTNYPWKYGAASLAIVMAMPAFAQTATAAGAASDDMIIVTARKRAEDIQTVPIAIESYTAQALTERNINTLADLSNNTPGLAINSIAGGALVTIYIRGQAPANTNNDLNTEANVGVFIDGIYQTSRNTVDIISVLDVGQLDVVKGPQSALYGRSTFAGALGIFTPAPSGELSGRIEGTVGTNEDYRVRGSISGPLIKDKLNARLSAGYLHFGGTAENKLGENTGGYKKYAISGSLEAFLTDRLTARLNAFATHSESEVGGIRLVKPSENNCGATESVTQFKVLRCGPLQTDRVINVSPDIPDTTFSSQQVSLDLNYEADAFTLVSVSGLTWAKNRTYNDYDGTGDGELMGVCTIAGSVTCGTGNQPYNRTVRVNIHTSAREQVQTFSQELRIQSPESSKFQWMLGGFYFNSRILDSYNPGVDSHIIGGQLLNSNERIVQIYQGLTPPGTGPIDGTIAGFPITAPNVYLATSRVEARTRTSSIFGSLGYDFGQVRVSAEARYNIDDKVSQAFLPVGGVAQNIELANAKTLFPVLGNRGANKFKSFTPRFSIDYRPTNEIFLYATAAKGVRSGGFNNQTAANAVLPEELAYDEEKNWTYEVGLKSNWLDNRLQVNLSAFRVDWSDMQISVFTANPLAPPPAVVIIDNAGRYRVEGVEGNIEVRPTDMFGFGGSFNFSNPRFLAGSYDTTRRTACIVAGVALPPCVAATIQVPGGTAVVPDLTGKRTPRSVRTSWNLHATANIPLGNDWQATGRVDVNYTGDAFVDLVNSSFIPSRTLTNLRFGFNNDKYSIAVFATNVFDKIYVQNAIVQPRANLPFLIRVPEAIQGERRRIGVTAAARF